MSVLCFGNFYDLQGQSRREIGHWLCKEQYPYLVVNFVILYRLGMIVLWLNIDVFIILNIGYI